MNSEKHPGYELHPKFTPIILNIQKTNTDDHQLIYASQLYGTFFTVSACLKINEKNELTGMLLTLVNYKGLLNIGILPETKKFQINGQGHAILELHLSALYGRHGSDRRVEVTCEPYSIAKLKDLKVTRKLWSFANYEDGDLTSHLDDEHFDSEFYERDGSAIFKKHRMDIVSQGKPTNIDDGKIDVMTSPTGQCKNTFAKFI